MYSLQKHNHSWLIPRTMQPLFWRWKFWARPGVVKKRHDTGHRYLTGVRQTKSVDYFVTCHETLSLHTMHVPQHNLLRKARGHQIPGEHVRVTDPHNLTQKLLILRAWPAYTPRFLFARELVQRTTRVCFPINQNHLLPHLQSFTEKREREVMGSHSLK